MLQTKHSLPEYTTHEEFLNRSKKLHELKEMGIDPYPHSFSPSHGAQALLEEVGDDPVGNSEDAMGESTPLVSVSGRLVLFRAMGKNAFGHLQDGTTKIQVMFNRDKTKIDGYEGEDPRPIKVIEKKFDLGDIVGVEGRLFRTGKGEVTILVEKATLLCKALLPLADKHAGLADKEMRYRKRWLDMITHPDVSKVFRTRSRIMKVIRDQMEQLDFMEVETPILQSLYGGAEARPFETKLNALDQKMYMRIALEISLKKLLVGGVNRVFEIGKVFRNEGIDRTHNPEFTLFEAYAANWDYNDMMHFVETLYETIAMELFGTTEVVWGDEERGDQVAIQLKAPWERLTMKEAISRYGKYDVDGKEDGALRERLAEFDHIQMEEIKAKPRGILVQMLFEELVEAHLIQPVHIIDHPIETTPLCKPHRRQPERDEGLVERFESFVLGNEICNAYTELNDPLIQRELLEGQAIARDGGDEEAHPLDEEFIEAICQGMPPASGIGIGIDRLVMLFTNCRSIRDVLYFPWMKPEA